MWKAKLVHKPKNKFPNVSNGETFLVGPTQLNKGTHYYFYTLDGKFLGCFPSEWFKLLETHSSVKTKEHSKKEINVEQFEQLTLF